MSKVPGMWRVFMAFGTIFALLWVALFIASPTVGFGIFAAGSMALALFFDLIIWRTYNRKP